MENPYLPYPARIDSVHVETEDRNIKSFKLIFENAEHQEKFVHQAGQFAKLSIAGKGEIPIGIASSPTEKGYLLFADENDNEPVLADYTRGVPKGIGFTRKKPPVWFKWVPVRIRGMVLAGRHLFVAGPPDVVDIDDPMAAFEGRKGAVLRAHWAADGNLLVEHKLDAPPVFDGLIAANGQLYLSLEDGTVLCMGPDR